MTNGQEPAFPEPFLSHPDLALNTKPGLTKREYLASAAMIGLLSNPNIKRPHPCSGPMDKQRSDFSKICLEYADELLKALES